MAEVTTLVTGVAGVRLAGDAVLDLWDGDGRRRGRSRRGAPRAASGSDMVRGWYARFAESLVGQGACPSR